MVKLLKNHFPIGNKNKGSSLGVLIHFKRTRFFIVAIIFLLVALAVYFLVSRRDRQITEEWRSAYSSEQLEAYDSNNNENRALILAISGKKDEAIIYANNEIKKASTPDEKVIAYNKLAAVYLSLKDMDQTLAVAEKSNEVKQNAQSWFLIGQVATAKNDNKSAIIAYQKAVDLSPDDGTNDRSDHGYYNIYLNEAKTKQ